MEISSCAYDGIECTDLVLDSALLDGAVSVVQQQPVRHLRSRHPLPGSRQLSAQPLALCSRLLHNLLVTMTPASLQGRAHVGVQLKLQPVVNRDVVLQVVCHDRHQKGQKEEWKINYRL
jgi:hypothetical protein